MADRLCIDASLALKLVLPDPDSPTVRALWQRWVDAKVELVAPPLWIYEVTSALRNKVSRRLLSPQAGEAAFQAIHAQGVRFLHPPGLHEAAWKLAHDLQRPTAYDSFYLALAQELGCPCWTADKRLYQAVKHKLDFVKWIGEAESA